MKRFIVVGGLSMLAIGLAVGLALAAEGPGGPGRGPGPGGPGMGGPGMGPGGPGMGGGQFAPGEPHPGGPPQGGPGGQGMQHQGPPPLGQALEHKMGKPLTPGQLEQLRAAGEAHRDAIRLAHEAFVKKLSTVATNFLILKKLKTKNL